MRRTGIIIIAAVILLLSMCGALAADGDVTRFGNSTAVTATIGGSNGTLNYTGAGFGKSLNVSGDVCIIGGVCLSTTSGNGITNGSDANLKTLNVTTKLNAVATNLTTLQITENTNLYYTDGRAALACVNTTILRNGSNANFATLNASTLNVGTTNLTCAQVSGCVVGAAPGQPSGWTNTSNAVMLSNNATNVSIGNSSGSSVGANLFVDETNGRIGIRTNTPTDVLDIHGNMDINVSGGNFDIYNTTGSWFFQVNGSNGFVGIGTSTPGFPLDVRGAINSTGLVKALEFSGPINESFIKNTPTNCTGDNFFQIGEAGGLRFCSTLNNSAINLNTLNGTLNVTGGGTGLKTYTTGDLLTGNSIGGLDVVAASTSGQVLTSNGASTKPTWQAAAGGAVTLLRNITFANSNASKYIVAQGDVAATCNTYHICLNIYQNSSNAQGSLGIRVNDISTGAYKANRVAYSTLANPSTETAWMFQAQSTGSQDFFGCVDVSRQLNAQGDLLLSGTITGSDQIVFWGGRNAASGALTNVSLGVYNTTGQANTNLTGTAEVYCMRNQ